VSKTYLYTSSAISTQDSFEGNDFVNNLTSIGTHPEIIHPVYKTYIPPMGLRRMGPATKMSVACAFKCLKNINLAQPDSIITATGFGALVDTLKFLNVSITVQNALLPPTSFIQSGHNSMAGQIALMLKNDCYNMTHVQQGLSFEYAMLDTMLSISEGKQNVLTGAVDEHIPVINDLANRFKLDQSKINQLSQGASFFVFGPDKSKAVTEVKAISIVDTENITEAINAFLSTHNIDAKSITMGFIGNNLTETPTAVFPFDTICYTDYCGQHAASSSFGLHYASEYMRINNNTQNTILININPDHKIGLTLLARV
jgi:hypothetical protein